MAAPHVEGLSSSNTYSPVFSPASVRAASPPPRCRSAPDDRVLSRPIRLCHCRLPADRLRVHNSEGSNPDRWILVCPRTDPSTRCSLLLRESDLLTSAPTFGPNRLASPANTPTPPAAATAATPTVDIDAASPPDLSDRMSSRFHPRSFQAASTDSSTSESLPPPPPAPNPPFSSGSRVRFDSPYESPPPPYEPPIAHRDGHASASFSSSLSSPPVTATTPPLAPVSISEPPSEYGSPVVDVSDAEGENDEFVSTVIQSDNTDIPAQSNIMPVIIEESTSYTTIHVQPHHRDLHCSLAAINSATSTTTTANTAGLAGTSAAATVPSPSPGIFCDPRVYSNGASSTSSTAGPSIASSSAPFRSPPTIHKRKWEDYATAATSVSYQPDGATAVPDSHNVFTPHEMAAESSAAAASRRRRESMNANANGAGHHSLHPHHIHHPGPVPTSAASITISPLLQPQPQHYMHPTTMPLSHGHSHTIPIPHGLPLHQPHPSPHMNGPVPVSASSSFGIPIPSGALPAGVSPSDTNINLNSEIPIAHIDLLARQVYDSLCARIGINNTRETDTGTRGGVCNCAHCESQLPKPSPPSNLLFPLPFSIEDLKQVLHPWATQIQGMAHTQYISDLTTRAKDAKITELQHRINTLEAELAAERAISSKYRWERDVMET